MCITMMKAGHPSIKIFHSTYYLLLITYYLLYMLFLSKCQPTEQKNGDPNPAPRRKASSLEAFLPQIPVLRVTVSHLNPSQIFIYPVFLRQACDFIFYRSSWLQGWNFSRVTNAKYPNHVLRLRCTQNFTIMGCCSQ